jgi:hypothetical protein
MKPEKISGLAVMAVTMLGTPVAVKGGDGGKCIARGGRLLPFTLRTDFTVLSPAMRPKRPREDLNA